MMFNAKRLTAAAMLCFSALMCNAQSNISAALTGLGADFGDRENAPLYKIKADDNGKILVEPGIRLGAELYANDFTSLKFAQTIRMDCMKKAAFTTELMLRFRLFKIYKHSLSIGFGGAAFYRKTWQDIEGYKDDGYKNGTLQNKVLPTAELEYNYVICKKNDLSFAVTHFGPKAVGFAVGVKHWFSRKSSHCNTCPSFH